jgi:hypothetical protein
MSSRAVAWLAMACTACTQVLAFDDVTGGRAPDRSAARDGGMDASESDAGDAAMELGYCESVGPLVAFCDDFDVPEEPFTYWTGIDQVGGTLRIDTEHFVTPEGAMLVTTDGYDAGTLEDGGVGNASAHVVAALVLDLHKSEPVAFVVTFDIGVDAHDVTEGAWATFLRFVYDGDEHDVLMDFDLVPTPSQLGLFVDEWEYPVGDGGVASTIEPLPGDALEPRTWYEVQVRIELDEPNGFDNSFSVSIDRVPRLARPLNVSPAGGTPVFEIGIIDMSPNTVAPWIVRFDNFVLEIEER